MEIYLGQKEMPAVLRAFTFAGLGFADFAFAVEDLGDGALGAEDVEHVGLFKPVFEHQLAQGNCWV